MRLEYNLRALWSGASPGTAATDARASLPGRGPMQYLGATLWASYIPASFTVCGHGMGPNMAAAAKGERCAEREGIGPFPYVAGTLEVLSMVRTCISAGAPTLSNARDRALTELCVLAHAP